MLRFLFFLTPIIYPMSLLEGRPAIGSITYDQLILLNPMTWFVGVARSATYMLEVPSATSMLVVLVVSAGHPAGWLVDLQHSCRRRQ